MGAPGCRQRGSRCRRPEREAGPVCPRLDERARWPRESERAGGRGKWSHRGQVRTQGARAGVQVRDGSGPGPQQGQRRGSHSGQHEGRANGIYRAGGMSCGLFKKKKGKKRSQEHPRRVAWAADGVSRRPWLKERGGRRPGLSSRKAHGYSRDRRPKRTDQ